MVKLQQNRIRLAIAKWLLPLKRRMLADRLSDAGQMGKHGQLLFCCSEHVSPKKTSCKYQAKLIQKDQLDK